MSTITSQDSDLYGHYAWTDTLKGVYYGPGCLNEALPRLLKTLGATKALVVTSKSLNEKTDIVRKVEQLLRDEGAYGDTFVGIGEHAPIAGIRSGVEAYRKHKCDIIVSVGGGSPIDASKAILHTIQQEDGGPTPRQIAIPTTLSAAEYTASAGFTSDEGHKVGVASPELPPAGIILDAELTLATPMRLWLSTGIRALDHAVETLYRPGTPPPLKFLAYSTITELFKYLPESKANPEDLVVRQKLQIASWTSLWPMKRDKNGAIGLSHALGHKLGATYGIPHGITSCLTLAPTVALKADIASESDKSWLSDALIYLQLPRSNFVEVNVRQLSKAIRELVSSLGLGSSLAEYKVPKEDLPKIAAGALGGNDDPNLPMVVQLLESIYSA
ncbi:hypothetical protein AX16_010634 [Volvariella volvacea WC 439]|nr:hypothetical protein AX16_010634 [Volvariella volvacea WC 439]